MTRYFTESADKFLSNWLSVGTWHTSHSADEGRFYRFVNALYKNDDWHDLRKILLQAVLDYHQDVSKSFAEEKVADLAYKAEIAFAFLRATETPDVD